MHSAISEEQAMLREAVAGFLATRYPFAARVAAARSQPGFDVAVWRGLTADLGLGGMAIPLEHGGLASSFADQMVVMEECGRALLVEPLAESCFLAAPLLARLGGPAAALLLPGVASGEVRLALALGEADMGHDLADIGLSAVRTATGWRLDGVKSLVVAAPWADHLIVAARSAGNPGDRDGLTLFLVDAKASGLTIERTAMLDYHNAARLEFDNVEVTSDSVLGELDHGAALLERVLNIGRVAVASELLGVAEGVFARTVAYLKERKQFGRLIGEFQALQHRAAHLYVEIEITRAAVLKAAQALDSDPERAAALVAVAKAKAGSTATLAVQEGVQMHGGMGMTDAFDIGFFMKRARVCQELFGDSNYHAEQLARLKGY